MNDRHIIEALQAQLAGYQKLGKLAETQRDHVQQGSVESLLHLLDLRQAVVQEISRWETVLAPVRRNWTETMRAMSPEYRTLAESLVAQARQLLEQITRSDQDDVMLLQQRKLNVGRQISTAAATAQVNRAYASTAYGRAGGSARTDVSQ